MNQTRIDDSDLELVRRVARRVWRLCGKKPDLDDLESDGLEQVARQFGTWRPEGGLSWQRFVAERARYGMIDGIRGRMRAGRIPPDGSAVLSLDCPVDDGQGAETALGELIADPRTDVERHVELRLAVADLLRLPEREREVLIRHAAGETLKSIGERLGIGWTRAAQIEEAAARRLAAPSPLVERPESSETANLTPPELGALEGAALGMTAAETAAALRKGLETVKDQRKAVLRKLGARDMTNAVFLASKAGMLDHLEGTEAA